MRKNRKVTLSQALDAKAYNSHILELPARQISIIDKVSGFLIQDIKILRLQNNRINQLGLINQFFNLQQLNLKNNRINDGKQLLKLGSLKRLKFLYVHGNDFLKSPIQDQVIQFLLTKTTDLGILDSQKTKMSSQVQRANAKIVFLEQFLNKVQSHQQIITHIKSKSRSGSPKKSFSPQRKYKQTEHILPKQVVIHKPRSIVGNTLKSKEKKNLKDSQTLYKKEATKIQIETLNINNNKLNELIKQAEAIVEQQQQQIGQLNRTLKKQKLIGEKMIRSRLQSSRRSIIDKYQKFSVNQSEPRALEEKDQDKQPPTWKKYLKNVPISMSKPELERSKSFSQQKQKPYLKVKPSQERNILQREKSLSQHKLKYRNKQLDLIDQASGQNNKQSFDSIKLKSPSSLDNSFQEQFNNFRQRNKSLKKQYDFSKQPRFPQKSLISPRHGSFFNQSFENIETHYYKCLNKIDPIFNLLYSPLQSLKQQQKNNLLNSLAVNHKQIWQQLAVQRQANKCLNQENNVILKKTQQQSKQYQNLLRETQGNLHEKEISLRLLADEVNCSRAVLHELQINNRMQQTQLQHQSVILLQKNKQMQFWELKSKQLQSSLSKYEEQQFMMELISQKRDARLKKQYLQKVKSKARKWHIFVNRRTNTINNQNLRLLELSLSLLKRQKLLGDLAKINEKKYNKNIQRTVFLEWKQQIQLEIKEKHLYKQLKTIYYKDFLSKLQSNLQTNKNVRQINSFTIKHHEKRLIVNNMNAFKLFYITAKQKMLKSQEKYANSLFHRVFRSLISNRQHMHQTMVKVKQLNEQRKMASTILNLLELAKEQRSFRIKKEQIQKAIFTFAFKRIRKNMQNQLKIQKKKLKLLNDSVKKIKFQLMLGFIQKEASSRVSLQQKKLNSLKYLKKINFACFCTKIYHLQKKKKVFARKLKRWACQLRQKAIIIKKKSFQLKKSISQNCLKVFFLKFKIHRRKHKDLKTKNQAINNMINQSCRNRLKQFFTNNRLFMKQKRVLTLKKTISLRQKQWIERLCNEDKKHGQTLKQISLLNNTIKENQICLMESKQELTVILEHKDKIIQKLQFQIVQMQESQTRIQQKYSKLLDLYSIATQNLAKKESDFLCLWDSVEKNKMLQVFKPRQFFVPNMIAETTQFLNLSIPQRQRQFKQELILETHQDKNKGQNSQNKVQSKKKENNQDINRNQSSKYTDFNNLRKKYNYRSQVLH